MAGALRHRPGRPPGRAPRSCTRARDFPSRRPRGLPSRRRRVARVPAPRASPSPRRCGCGWLAATSSSAERPRALRLRKPRWHAQHRPPNPGHPAGRCRFREVGRLPPEPRLRRHCSSPDFVIGTDTLDSQRGGISLPSSGSLPPFRLTLGLVCIV